MHSLYPGSLHALSDLKPTIDKTHFTSRGADWRQELTPLQHQHSTSPRLPPEKFVDAYVCMYIYIYEKNSPHVFRFRLDVQQPGAAVIL